MQQASEDIPFRCMQFTVNALDDYAVGFKKYVDITAEDILSDNFIGLVKCDIEPAKNPYVPVLHDNSNGKLLFHLNPMKKNLGIC